MTATRFPLSASAARHAGLYLDKFLPGDEGKSKRELTNALADLTEIPMDSNAYRLAFERWKDYWMGRETVVCAEGTVRGRLVTGLGAESVIENGIRMHFTYGTPLIPGSTLKGVLRSAMPEVHLDASRPDKQNYEWYLFGGEDQEGAVKVQDALWIPEGGRKPLALDVLTPHHAAYMSKQGPPTDFDEPVPVQFLTIGAKQRFLFVIETPTTAWKKYMEGLLKDALLNHGVGAKRSAGYGVFEVSGA